MEQLGKTKQTSRKPAHQKKPQNHSRQAVFCPEILSAAASAAEHSLSESLLGVPPELLLSAGNQFLLRLTGRESYVTSNQEMRFSEQSPENSFEQVPASLEFQQPVFSGQLIAPTNINDISAGSQ